MKKYIFSIIAMSLVLSGCSLTDQFGFSDDGYRKVSITIDVAVGSDGSITQGNACFGNGTIASILYFPFKGGEVIEQTSTLTVNSVPCISCYSEITDSITTFPIELSAKLTPNSVAVSIGDEKTPSFMKDELKVWIETPPINSLNIYYDCGSNPDTLPDYGSAVSQIASPFMTTQWTQDLVLNEVQQSTFNDFEFPPTYVADITISSIEALVDNIGD